MSIESTNYKRVIVCIIFIACLFHNTTFAVDLGRRGTIFPIKEEGFVSMMIRKLKTIDIEKEQEKMKQIARDRVENPTPVVNVKPATSDREFMHDPSYTLTEDAVLPCGKILHKAGTKVNPLEHMSLERKLFFIDARETAQLDWLKEQLSKKNENKETVIQDRIILVGGSVFKLQEELGTEVYFDQSGELTMKFGIKASPAIAQQEGNLLRVKEFNMGKEK